MWESGKKSGVGQQIPVVVEAAVRSSGFARGVAGFKIGSSQLSVRHAFIAAVAGTGFFSS